MSLLSVLAITTALAGCSSGAAEVKEVTKPAGAATSTTEKLAPAKLKWVIRSAPQSDLALVQTEMNKIIKEKINTEVELSFIDLGVYDGKLKTMIAAGEEFDLAFVSSSIGGDFYGNTAKGAFLELDDLIKKHAQKTYEAIPKGFWNAVTVNNKIYAVPNYQIVARQNGIAVQKPIAEKYNFNVEGLKKLEDLEPLLAKLKAGEAPNKYVFFMIKQGAWRDMLSYYRIDPVGTNSMPGAVRMGDDSLKVFNQYEDPAFKEHVKLMADWYKKAIFPRMHPS